MIICAYDPGKTTGYAAVLWEDRKVRVLDVRDLSNIPQLWETLKRNNPDIIIYERFIYRGGVNADLSGCRQEGLFDLWNHLHPDTPVVVQSSTVKRFWTTELLKKEGFKVGSKHCMDALRHLLQYLTFDLKEYEIQR